MQSGPLYLLFDYETRSEADLKKVGVFEYSKHPSTKVLCVSWRLGRKENLKKAPVKSWSPALNPEIPSELLISLKSKSVKKVAHNAFFEQCITENVLKIGVDPTEWLCTAALSRSHACPGKLEQACYALDLPIKKDMSGHRLMLKLSKPRKATKHNKDKWHNSKKDLLRVMQYCADDVRAETELFLALKPLSPFEQKVWELDQKINKRGMPIDRALVLKALELIKRESENLNKEFDDITGLGSATRRDEVLKWLAARGIRPPNLQRQTVEELIKTDIDEVAKRVLEIRLSISKVSVKKYKAFEMRSRFDGRVRDLLIYHTATTGRWGGGGVQPQNLPRPLISQKDIEMAIEIILND